MYELALASRDIRTATQPREPAALELHWPLIGVS
jgi:hypothetical protein